MRVIAMCPDCENVDEPGTKICDICGGVMRDSEFSNGFFDDLDYPLEQIGSWSQVKHAVLQDYLSAYTTILTNQSFVRRLVYIDGFAGTGYAEDRETGEVVRGSAIRAIETVPQFTHIHLIEKHPGHVMALMDVLDRDERVTVHHGDCIELLRRNILPLCRYEDFARAICLLDPYGLSVPWSLLAEIGAMRSVEIFFNFMVVAANRNVLWHDRTRVSDQRKKQLDYVWGDRSWEPICYPPEQTLFGESPGKKTSNEVLVEAFRQRLLSVARFQHVPKPIPIRNAQGATIYYLFFAGHNRTGAQIVSQIFDKYRIR